MLRRCRLHLFILLSLTPLARAQSMLPGGDFEGGLSGWEPVAADGVSVVTSADKPAQGRSCLQLQTTGKAPAWVLSPALTGPGDGELALLSFTVRRGAGQSGLMLDIVGGAAELGEAVIWEARVPEDTNWHKVSLLLRIPPVRGGGAPRLAYNDVWNNTGGDYGGSAVADGGAHHPGEGEGDLSRSEHLFKGHGFSVLCMGVQRSVPVSLDGESGEMFLREPVPLHVSSCQKGVHVHEDAALLAAAFPEDPVPGSDRFFHSGEVLLEPLYVHCSAQSLKGFPLVGVVKLLESHDENAVVHSTRNGGVGQVESR